MQAELSPEATYRVEDHYSPKEIEKTFRLGVINGIFYLFAATLLDPTLVLVAFLSNLTDSVLLLGLVVPLSQAGWSLPQLFISGYVQNQPVKINIYKRASYIRVVAWGILAAAMNFVRNPDLMLILFFLTFSTSSLASGLGGLPFTEVVSKTIPPRRRGELFAIRLGMGGLVSVAGSFFVRWILGSNSPLEYPHNYGLLGFLYFIFASVGLMIFNQVKEKPDEIIVPRRKLGPQIKLGWQILKENINYRYFVIVEILMIFSGVAVPFFAVYTQQQLGGSSSWVGIYLVVAMVSNLTVNLIFSRISRRISNQLILKIAAFCGIGMSLWVLIIMLVAPGLSFSSQLVSFLLIPAFILNSFRQNGLTVSGNSLLLSITPPQIRTVMLGFTQTLLGVFLVTSGFAGIIVRFAGFPWLLVFTLFVNIGAGILVKNVREGEM